MGRIARDFFLVRWEVIGYSSSFSFVLSIRAEEELKGIDEWPPTTFLCVTYRSWSRADSCPLVTATSNASATCSNCFVLRRRRRDEHFYCTYMYIEWTRRIEGRLEKKKKKKEREREKYLDLIVHTTQQTMTSENFTNWLQLTNRKQIMASTPTPRKVPLSIHIHVKIHSEISYKKNSPIDFDSFRIQSISILLSVRCLKYLD